MLTSVDISSTKFKHYTTILFLFFRLIFLHIYVNITGKHMMHQMTSCYFMPPPQDGNKIFPPPCRALLTCRCLTRFKMGSFSYFLSECGGFTSVQCLRFHEEKIISLLSLFGVIDGSLFCEFLLFNFSLSEVFKI